MEWRRGEVRIGKLPYFRGEPIVQPGKMVGGVVEASDVKSWKQPNIPGFTSINVSSSSPNYKELSPMKLGPFVATERRSPNRWYPDGIHPGFRAVDDEFQQATVQVFENYWQGSKIYPKDVVNEIIQPSFYQRRAKLFADPKGHRRALPKSAGKPKASYFNDEVLFCTQARIYYIQNYIFLVEREPKYWDLVKRVNEGENLQILGYDGYDPVSGLPFGAHPLTYEAMERAMYDPNRSFGHEFVLAGLLSGIKPWENFDGERALEQCRELS